MSEVSHALISLDQRHADNIFRGTKRVELRRRSMNLAPGAIVWIYVKVPVGSIVGQMTVSNVHLASPSTLWRKFGAVSGLTRGEFYGYFEGVDQGFALEITKPKRMNSSVSLEDLRKVSSGFHPPQFFTYLPAQHPIYGAVVAA